MTALQGHKALIKISGTPTATTNENTSTSDNQLYQIDDTSKRIMALGVDITVKEDGSTTTEIYTVSRVSGTIRFNSVDATRGAVTVSYSYLSTTQVAEAHEYDLTITSDLHDITPFISAFIARQSGLKSGSGSLSDFGILDTYFEEALMNGNAVILELYPSTTEVPFVLFAQLNSIEVSAAVASIQDKSISFDSTQEMIGFN